jgi:vacuolar-type H+-ATPase subunit H
MSKIGEAIRDISGWEKEADALAEQSKSEAEGILHQAREESREVLSAAEARCASERETLLENADEEGLREAGKIDQEAKDSLKRLGETVSSRRAAAVDLVLKEMRELYGGR